MGLLKQPGEGTKAMAKAKSKVSFADLLKGGLLGDKAAMKRWKKADRAHKAVVQAALNPSGPTLKQAGKKKKKKKHPMDPRNDGF